MEVIVVSLYLVLVFLEVFATAVAMTAIYLLTQSFAGYGIVAAIVIENIVVAALTGMFLSIPIEYPETPKGKSEFCHIYKTVVTKLGDTVVKYFGKCNVIVKIVAFLIEIQMLYWMSIEIAIGLIVFCVQSLIKTIRTL